MTKAFIQTKITTDQRWLQRAVLAIDARQTNDEQYDEQTKYLNSCGWSAVDAKRGSYYARWIKSGRDLGGRHLIIARKMMLKYADQLLRVAEEKAAQPA